MVLRKVEGGWRIAHIHWSSRRVPSRAPASSAAAGVEPRPTGGAAQSSAPIAGATSDHLSLDALMAQLQSAGLKVERKGSVRQPFFGVPATELTLIAAAAIMGLSRIPTNG